MFDFDKKGEGDTGEDEFFGPKIKIMGVGGAGCNTIFRMSREEHSSKVPMIAANTDQKHLNTISGGVKKLLLGKSVTNGLGAGGYPEVAMKAALNSKEQIESEIAGTDLLFLVAGMGGGTGTGAAPVIADIARQSGCLVASFVTYPFKLERARLAKARDGIDRLKEVSDTMVIIDNNRLLDWAPNVQIEKAFQLVDDITARAVMGISETILEPSLINVDFADLRSILENGGVSMMSLGEASGIDRNEEIIKATLTNKLLDIDTKGAKGALVHLAGGADLTLGDANHIAESLTEYVPEDANVILGARAQEGLERSIRAMVIFTGLKDSYKLG
ncbi:MAG: cell division protein FtsZ [Candidatus Micrarchaeia archaeon]